MYKKIIPETYYFITGVDRKTSTRKYVAIDAGSGGYPWWSDCTFEKYTDLDKATAEMRSSYTAIPSMRDVEIVAVTSNFQVLDIGRLHQIEREKLLNEAEVLRKALQDKLDEVENLK